MSCQQQRQAASQPQRKRERPISTDDKNDNNKLDKVSRTLIVKCPKCPTSTQKRFKLGRSLRMHVESVHWLQHRQEHLLSTSKSSEELRTLQATYVEEVLATAENDDSHHDLSTSSIKPKQSFAIWEKLARDGDVTGLLKLKTNGKWRFDSRGKHGALAEHWAAGSGQLECLKFCVKERLAGCPLHGENHTIPELSEQRKCTCNDSFGKRKDGRSALHWAARNGHLNIVEWLLEPKRPQSNGNVQEDKQYRVKVDSETYDGTTPLMLAVYGGHPNVVRMLIDAGADVFKRNRWGCDTSHWAGLSACHENDANDLRLVCDILHKECGVQFDQPQQEGHSAIHKAAFKGNNIVFQWMIDGGVSRKHLKRAFSADNSQKFPSDIATMQGYSKLAAEMKKVETELRRIGYDGNDDGSTIRS